MMDNQLAINTIWRETNTHTLVKLPDITSSFGKDIPAGLLTSLTNLESLNKTLQLINKKTTCFISICTCK